MSFSLDRIVVRTQFFSDICAQGSVEDLSADAGWHGERKVQRGCEAWTFVNAG